MSLKMQQKLWETLAQEAATVRVEDVRIGLGYTAVTLAGARGGLAWTPRNLGGGCSHLHAAGTLWEKPAGELLAGLVSEKPLLRAVGLATANALLAGKPREDALAVNALEPLAITKDTYVVMVGYFGPLVRELQEVGCRLDIVELDASLPGVLTPEQGKAALGHCEVAILTGTSLVTGTLDGLLDSLGKPRGAMLLGPSAPLCPELFAGTPLTQVSGARVRDCEGVLRVVSEGGGTPLLKKYVAFETVMLDR